MTHKIRWSNLGMLLAGAIAVGNLGCGGGSASTSPPPPPLISVTLTPATAQKLDQGQSVSFTATVANDSSSKGVKWSLSGTGCMGAACGALSNQTATTATYIAPSPVAANVSVSVTATSAADSTKSASDSVTVFQPPTVTTTSLQNATGGSAYNVTLQESGGIAPFTWSLASGSSLPAGLSLDSNGTISGTPTAGGLFNFTVQVADSANPPVATTAKLSLTIVILPPSPVPATVSGTVAVGTAPSAIAVDSTNNKIYVTDFGTLTPLGGQTCSPSGADVKVIDGATQSTTSIGFGFVWWASLNPFAVTVNPVNHTFYVLAEQFAVGFSRKCGSSLDGVEVFDATSSTQTMNIVTLLSNVVVMDSSGKVVATIPVGAGYLGSSLGGIDVNPSTGSIYAGPAGVAVNPTTNKIYVANSTSNNVSVIDGATNSVTTTITDPNAMAPVAVAVNPATNTIYVANHDSNNISVIDGFTGSLAATVAVGTSPKGVAVDAQRNVIYVANAGNSQTGNPGNITVIDGATNHTTTLTDPKATNPVAVAVNSATNKIYVANSGSNNVTVIDGAH